MKIFFTADTHLGHERILEMRPFGSVEEHDNAIIDGINRVAGKKDLLFVLGDFSWRNTAEYIAKYIERIKCKRLSLIIGNHDRPAAVSAFETAKHTAVVTISGRHKLFLSHYPHAYWPSSHWGSLHLYGHMHGTKEDTLHALFPGRRSMDAGVDNAKRLLGEYRPFSELEVMQILCSRPGHHR